MINKIKFKSFKSYKDWQELEIKPLTVLFGKNSSGKSAITKLPTMLEESLNGINNEPIQLNNNGIELGTDFKDLVYGRIGTGELEFKIYEDKNELFIKIASKDNTQKITFWELNDRRFIYDYHKDSYIDKLRKEYICDFKGFNLESLECKAKGTIEDISGNPTMGIKTAYFGPFRSEPKVSYTQSQFKNIHQFGVKGENAYFYLIKDSQTHEKELLNKVSKWFKENFEGWEIDVKKDIERPIFYIELIKESLNINITNVGQGMSQVLPLIVKAFYPEKEPTLIIIEQPELHLHPAAHGNLAELFVYSANSKNKQYLIETHSKNFILRIRRLIAEGKFSKDNLALYWVDFNEEKNTSSLKRINVDEKGKVDNWPENVFSESLDETIAIRMAQKG